MYLPHWPIPSSLGKRAIDYETVFLRMKKVLQNLDNPQEKMPPIIHVTGTNGKGSVIAFLAAILEAKGLKVHIYTSPHLHNCNERIVLAGEKISDTFLFEVMEAARIAASQDDVALTFFEGFTIGAFLAFAKVPADVVLIECGMGARLDATNIFDKKLATIIAPISFDHTEYLGDSIAKIAFEKAHIIRPQTPVVVGPQPLQAKQIIELVAKDQNATMIRYDEEFSIVLDEEKNSFDLNFYEKELCDLPAPALIGEHQYINAAIAISCALILPFAIDEDAVKLGLSRAKWPSRLEKINNNLAKILKNPQSEILLDGAHNQAGAFALARFIAKEKQKNPLVKNYLICGFTKNKCKKEFLENFVNVVDEACAVRVDGEPNPEDAEIIAEIGEAVGLKILPQEDLLEAIYSLSKLVGDEACRVVICGSLHLARDVRKFGNYPPSLNK